MEDRLEIWLELIGGKLDRLIEIGESLEGQVRLPSEDESKTFSGAKDPAKEAEPEHPAGPQPDPGEGYRLLSKDPPEDLRDGDELFHSTLGRWCESIHAGWGYKRQDPDCWYRRKIETAKEPVHPAVPMPSMEGYRPVDDGDVGKIVEVQNSSADPWRECTLLAIDWDRPYGFLCRHVGFYRPMQWRFARIKIDEPAKEEPADEPPKKWRILEPGEVVCSSDLVNAKSDFLSDPPSGPGWRPVENSVGMTVHKDDFCVFARPVAEEPAKEPEPEHPVVPMPDPGEGYRILGKNPPEDLTPEIDDWWEYDEQRWRGVFPLDLTTQHPRIWYRRKIEVAKPAWEPKVGDWVRVTRPEDWRECRNPDWSTAMHQYHGKVMQVSCYEKRRGAWVANFYGVDWFFHRDWLSPAEPPATEKPAEPEYREPVLPGDAGKRCEFSISGKTWDTLELVGWNDDPEGWPWKSRLSNNDITCWKRCRIKKDA